MPKPPVLWKALMSSCMCTSCLILSGIHSLHLPSLLKLAMQASTCWHMQPARRASVPWRTSASGLTCSTTIPFPQPASPIQRCHLQPMNQSLAPKNLIASPGELEKLLAILTVKKFCGLKMSKDCWQVWCKQDLQSQREVRV